MNHDPESDPEIVLGPAGKIQILYTTIKDRVVVQLDHTNIYTRMNPYVNSAAKHHRKARARCEAAVSLNFSAARALALAQTDGQ